MHLTGNENGGLHLGAAFQQAHALFERICPDAVFMESEPIEGGPPNEEEEEEEMLKAMLSSALEEKEKRGHQVRRGRLRVPFVKVEV